MRVPSGTYNSATSGALQIFFSGQWSAASYDFGSGAPSDIILTCTVTDGSTTRSVFINMRAPSSSIDWDYVGGTTLTCAMSVTYYTIYGPGFVKAEKLRIRAILIKR